MTSNEPGVRVFVVHSEQRLAFERTQRVKSMNRVRTRLEKLEWRVANGKLKAAEKIGAAAAKILARNHGHRYYGWSYADGVFCFFEHPVHFTREQAYEGKYVIQTEEPNLSAVDAVRLYKELSEVERAFANLKDVLDMRPIYHRTDDRVQAHIFVAALAFLLHRAIEKKLKTARLGSLRHRSIDRPQVRACGRHRSWRRHHQALGHPWHSARRRSAARPRLSPTSIRFGSPTSKMFTAPKDRRTQDYITGRFG